MRTCNARVTWYREPGHVPVEDVCVLENGHLDYDHLPATKAAEQASAREWNQALDALVAAMMAADPDGDVLDDDTLTLLTRTVAGLKR